MRRLEGLLATMVVLIATLAAPQPALAHGRLAVSTPAEGGTLTEPVETVSLAFTEKAAPYAYFTVTSPSGLRVDGPWSHAEPYQLAEPAREYNLVNGVWETRLFPTGFPVKVPVVHWPEQGVYTMRYQSVASDGDEVKGQVRFTYAGAMTQAPAGWQPPANQPSAELLAAAGHAAAQAPSGAPAAAATTVEPPRSGFAGAWMWFALALVIAGVTVVVARRGPSPNPRRKPVAAQRKRR